MSKNETYVYVIDTTRGDRCWVRETYVQLYPYLYKPVLFNGQVLKSEIPNANPCVVST